MAEVIYLLNQSRDVSLAKLIVETSPVDVTVIINNASTMDEYRWEKRKGLHPCISDKEVQVIKSEINGAIVCNDVTQLKSHLKNCEVCLSRGREFFVVKELAKKSVALSLNRCYFNRLLDVLPFYRNLTIMMNSEKWLDKSCGSFSMGDSNYEVIHEYKNRFRCLDIMGYYYDYLKKQGKNEIKRKMGVPVDQKIAFVSFRMAQKDFSIYDSPNEFVDVVKKELERLKGQGYYLMSRRRLGKHDMAYYAVHKSPDIYGFDKVKHLMDLEINGSDGFPGIIWEGLFVSDIMFLADVSGICHNEAALCRCPVYMPYKNITNIGKLNPSTQDMINKRLIFDKLNDKNISYYNENIESFILEWYNTDVNGFWQEVLK